MNYMYADVTEKIIGASMKIHRYLGNGFQEVIYQRCLEIELKIAIYKSINLSSDNYLLYDLQPVTFTMYICYAKIRITA
jgi:GxxExxY protein